MDGHESTSPSTPSNIQTTVIGFKRKAATASTPGTSVAEFSDSKTSANETVQDVKDSPSSAKKMKGSRTVSTSSQDTSNDSHCWICHKEGEVICCETCPRVFHLRCIQLETPPTEDWVCPECILIMTAENMDTRSRAMRLLNVDQLCSLLRHALSRMRSISGVEPFVKPVDYSEFPSYKNYVSFPMDLQTIDKNVKKKHYGSTEAFLADTKWILHNCIIFNTTSSKLTSITKTLLRVCKHEMQELENCPDCYFNAHAKKDSWFVTPCRIPHLLVWAKLKGFPFWPGKAMRVNFGDESVDVRFFGAHDRAWIPLKDVFLYSADPPVVCTKSKRKGNLEACMQEVDTYIRNAAQKFGKFEYAPSKTPLNPFKEETQIKIHYPQCTLPFTLGTSKRRGRAYSYSGSDRSHADTPTPSETDLSEDLDPPAKLNNDESEETNLSQEKEDAPVNAPVAKVLATTDRTSVSPPCEVSSTTQAELKRTKMLLEDQKKEANEEKVPVKQVVIAETSETIEIEGDLEDENEIEEDLSEIDEQENDEKESPLESEIQNEAQVPETETDTLIKDVSCRRAADVDAEEPLGETDRLDTEMPPAAIGDDSAKASKPSTETEPVNKTASSDHSPVDRDQVEDKIGLGSDVSVTVIQKKRCPSTEVPATKISVKKEQDLLAVTTDIVNVSNVKCSRAKKSFPRSSSDLVEGTCEQGSSSAKSFPPDPIVTISKVQSLLRQPPPPPPQRPASGASLLTRPMISAAPPHSQPHLTSLLMGSPRLPPPPPRGVRGGSSNGSMMRLTVRPPGGHAAAAGGAPMPSLHPRPPSGQQQLQRLLPSSATSAAATGPVSEQMQKMAGKLVDFMRGTLEDLFREVASQGSLEAQVRSLQLEMEKMQWRHQQELSEMRHNLDLTLAEMRQSMEAEKQRSVGDLRKQFEVEKVKAVTEAKKKQWCANCGKEAIFYCCWNTSYCNYPCQQSHWPSHMTVCAQNQSAQDEAAACNGEGLLEATAGEHFLDAAARHQKPSGRNTQNMIRGNQGSPSLGSLGMNSRYLSSMGGMRFPRGPIPPDSIRFHGSYFM